MSHYEGLTFFSLPHSIHDIYVSKQISHRNGKKHNPPHSERILQKNHALFPPVFFIMQFVSLLQFLQWIFYLKYALSLYIYYSKF